MENASLENVSIELTQSSQNRGDENEYIVSSVFEDIIELETAQETQGEQSCLTSGISANINSRQPARRIAQAGATLRLSLPRETGVRDNGRPSAAEVTSNRDCQRVQPDDSVAYQCASLDDVGVVPNSVTRLHGVRKEGVEAVQKEDDTTKEQNSTPKRSVTINFRLTEDHFCCSSRESSLHLQLDIGNYEGTRNREDFAPQVICQEQARKTARDAVLRVTSTLVISSGSAEEEIVDFHRSPRSGSRTEMDDTDDFPESSAHEEPETPEYSPTDSESSEASDGEAMERNVNRSGSQSDLETQFLTAAAEESDVVRSEGVVNEENGESCVDHLEDTSDTQKSITNDRHSFEENMLNLGAEGMEKCKQSSKENLDENSMLSGTSLDSGSNSKTTVVCKNALNRAEPDKNSVHKDDGSPLSDTIKDNNKECIEAEKIPNNLHKEDFNSGEKASNVEENGHTESPLHVEGDKERINFNIDSETVNDERVLTSEILNNSEDQGLKFHGNDNLSITKEEKTITKAPDDLSQVDIETSTDGETQGQGDTSHSLTDDSSSDGTAHPKKSFTVDILEETKNERTVSNGEETQLKFTKTLEHVSEVPRGIFESILYKLYNRMNQRSPKARRDISRGPCVKQLVKEFSKEAMDCPKFPKSQSVQVQKTQEEIPKSQLFESLSDIDDSPRNQSIQVRKILEDIPKSQLFESFSDTDDRGFETRIETSTDDDLLSSDDAPIRSSTPSQEVVVMEIRDELQKPDCSSKRVIKLIKKFGGKGSFKKHKKIEDKIVKAEQVGEAQLPAEDVNEESVNIDVMSESKSKSEPVCEGPAASSRKGSSAWLTNVSVKNLVAIFSEFSNSPAPSRRSTSRASKKCSGRQGRETSNKASRTMETQTPGSEPIASCSNVLLLVQPEYSGGNMLSSRFERKRSTLSMCLPLVEPEGYEADGRSSKCSADPLRACASATGLLLVSTAEPVRVRALCSPDDNHAALSQLAHLLHLPDRKGPGRSRSVARDNSVVRQLVAQWDRSSN